MVLGINCKRTAPRYEPDPTPLIEDKEDIEKPAIDQAKSHPQNIAGKGRASTQSSDQSSILNNDAYLNHFLTEIEWLPIVEGKSLNANKNEYLTLRIQPTADEHNLNRLIERNLATNTLPHKLRVSYQRNQQDGSWNKTRLDGAASINLSTNPRLDHSEKHTYALIGFTIKLRKNNKDREDYLKDRKDYLKNRKDYLKDQENHLVAFVKKDANWFYYDNYGKATRFTKEIRLALQSGTCFFYQKIT